MAVRESPEIASVIRRIGEAWAARDYETYSNQISRTAHFRAIGTDADEFWDSAESFLGVRQLQAEELVAQDWDQSEATLERVDAFEDGNVGWASTLLTIDAPGGDVRLRVTAVLVLEAGAWRVIQWHSSIPTPNVRAFGVELTTTIDGLLNAVAEDTGALGTLDRARGTSTIVITDIVDSTVLTEQMGDAGWIALWKGHEADIRRVTERHHGTVVKMMGDGAMLAFGSARSAARAALAIRESTGDAFAVRTGMHAGEVVREAGDLLGVTVNKAARVASIAEGGEILASSIVEELIGTGEGLFFGPRRVVSLKGLSGSHSVVSVDVGPAA